MKMEEVFLFGLGERPDPSHVVFAVHILKPVSRIIQFAPDWISAPFSISVCFWKSLLSIRQVRSSIGEVALGICQDWGRLVQVASLGMSLIFKHE